MSPECPKEEKDKGLHCCKPFIYVVELRGVERLTHDGQGEECQFRRGLDW